MFFRHADGAMQRTQPEGSRSGPGDTDRQLYSLRKFVRLALGGNPSVLMVFWAPIIEADPVGHELRAVADRYPGGPRRDEIEAWTIGTHLKVVGVAGLGPI